MSPFPGTDGADVQYCAGETSSWFYPPHGLQGHFNKYIALLIVHDKKIYRTGKFAGERRVENICFVRGIGTEWP